MTERRKDNKNRVLREGEYQRENGTYEYKWRDRRGKRHSIYGKTIDKLRERETEILRDTLDGIREDGKNLTINDIYNRWVRLKRGLKDNTFQGYQYTYKQFVEKSFGETKIVDLKRTDVREFYNMLADERGLKIATIDCVHTVLHQVLELAVEDDYIRYNPSDHALKELKKARNNNGTKRRALTVQEQELFERYLEKNGPCHIWQPIFTVMLWTGMRVGECLGLRWEDIDLDNRIISVNHNLVDYQDRSIKKQVRAIQTTKTRAGVRTIPMIDEVYEAFITEYELQQAIGFCTEEISGYSGFIFATVDGKLMSRGAVNNAIHRIVAEHNKDEEKKAEEEGREPLLIPQFSAHQLRHTFCTRFCENETNLKVIQSIMGHSDITTTMDIYADATQEKKQEIMANLNGKIF